MESSSSGSTLYEMPRVSFSTREIIPYEIPRVSFSTQEIIPIERIYYPRDFFARPQRQSTYGYTDRVSINDSSEEDSSEEDSSEEDSSEEELEVYPEVQPKLVRFYINGSLHHPERFETSEPSIEVVPHIRERQILRRNLGLPTRNSLEIYPPRFSSREL